MIYFETCRETDVRLYKTAVTLDETFRFCGKYVLLGNDLVLLGGRGSVVLSPVTKSVSLDAPFRTFVGRKERARRFSQNSPEEKFIKALNDAFRQWFEIDPFPNFMEFEGALLETNKLLLEYGMVLSWTGQGMELFRGQEVISFEDGLAFILENDIYEDIGQSLTDWLNEAKYYKRTLQDRKAVRQYEKLLTYVDSSMELFTEIAFALGELYYFLGNYQGAVELYYRCDPDHVSDRRDFYVHIGHALLDGRMKNYESEIRLYYRSLVDNSFYEQNKRVIELATEEIAPNFPEYEEACFRVGQYKYQEQRRNRIETRDGKGKLVPVDKLRAAASYEPLKRYEGIKLLRLKSYEESVEETPQELLAKALSELADGEYQKAYEIYLRIAEKSGRESELYTWAMLQLAKLYSFFDDYKSALLCLGECRKEDFGRVYRKQDYMLLYVHSKIVLDDFESDPRFRKLIRGKFDSYYARYNREYYLMTRDRNLMEAFLHYEKECEENVLNQ